MIGTSSEGALRGAFGVLLGFLFLSDRPGDGPAARRILGLVREDEAAADDAGARGTREAAERRPAEDQEQTNN